MLKWRQRYLEWGVEGVLEDAPGRGRKKAIDPEKEAANVKATLETKPKKATHWSTRSLASEQAEGFVQSAITDTIFPRT